MIDRVGPYLVWALFLLATYIWAQPALIFIGAGLIVGLVLLGVTRRLS